MTSANKSLKKKIFLRLEQLLRIFRALQNSRVLHISMKARWHMNQLLISSQSLRPTYVSEDLESSS